ncbi:MAG TPA: hypothetical protein GXZ77_07955 [Papillibacter sp.]|jgi:hypothetical protein|nr:hypothetical protein [Papillibacter sp.]
MADRVVPGPVQDKNCIREAVCVHTRKIYDSCKDKDCIEDLRLYPTRDSQSYIDNAVSIRAKSAKLLFVGIDVDEISFNRGYYTVDLRFYYKIKGEAFSLVNRPSEITGLCVFDKRVILFGSEGNAKVFTSGGYHPHHSALGNNLPVAVVEAVDPIILGMKLVNVCDCHNYDPAVYDVPNSIAEAFESDILLDNAERRVLVTLGQFSIVRLERDTQLLIPSYDYCLPEKECLGSSDEDPCTLFSRIQFPVDEFFPPDTLDCPSGYREAKASIIN